VFVIEDEIHAESQGEFRTREEAMATLTQLATIPWDQEPNVAPCMGWRNCGRDYELVEYDETARPWKPCCLIVSTNTCSDRSRAPGGASSAVSMHSS
jgi:hypothetical protein